MYKSYVPYLQHILDECLYVRSVIKDDMQREEFLRDETLKRAVTRSLSIIGEATKKFPIGPISHPLYITFHLNQKIIASIQLPHLLSNTLSNQISSLYEVHANVLRLLVSQRKPCEDLPCFQNPYFPFLPVSL